MLLAHTIALHLLDAPGRPQRFMRKHRDLLGRIPKKELASYLDLTPETLSRLKKRNQPGGALTRSDPINRVVEWPSFCSKPAA